LVLFIRALAEPVLVELEEAPAERICFQHVDANLKERGVDVRDQIGAMEDQILVAPFDAAIPCFIEVEALNRGSHGAVVENDTLTNQIEIGRTLVGQGFPRLVLAAEIRNPIAPSIGLSQALPEQRKSLDPWAYAPCPILESNLRLAAATGKVVGT
jgi:hypothetical protein